MEAGLYNLISDKLMTEIIYKDTFCLRGKKLPFIVLNFDQVHGDVFRPASNCLMFSAFVGTGYQIASVVFIVICFAIVGDLYTE